MATPKAIQQAMQTLLAAGLANAPSTPERVQLVLALWADCLDDLDDAGLAAAVRAYLRDPACCQFWPQPGAILAHEPKRQLAAIDDSDQAWGRIVQLAERGQLWSAYGSRTAELSPEEQAGVDAAGGRQTIALSPYEHHGTMRAAFRGAYRSARASGAVREQHPQLTADESRGLLLELSKARRGAS